ncbi:hypothetical protein K7X08_002265 [Anisodus acutangulus]|uniref:Midasin n=1 Tax=Anisodus acutangulus TaxID=402998 RepID=A0A9Q1LSF1_9SOLA|nr:hypothetical protein K7X08_002265 [Anisodus acutangulus]
MFDAAAANARLPSGHNRLEQVVLIIADGWFHEKEATFQGGEVKLSKYLDSFPFPYYVVLRTRTLADLLRQWFELMQQSRD